ncbi:hypothetical protein [Cohnella candidum]|uniref:t-SNARE coiled-coil homology domain-containing protein n=1 Tax=Cohnella candidum TaxID=2674991 RepID=A0A3G3JSG4_9BACL|nr:hypothetical protein [Cohnella candidum]AYQ71166.1 hypothetical protein EAV92_00200 [Cohnella candidum]
MSDQKLTQIEHMLTELIHSVGSLKAYFEEEREENGRRFAQIDERFAQMDKKFEQMDKRFDDLSSKLDEINNDQHYMAARIFQNEMEVQKVKDKLLNR